MDESHPAASESSVLRKHN